MFGFGMGWGMLIGIVVLALIAYVIYYAITGSSTNRRPTSHRGQRALKILKERYARGEITREEYFKMRKELEE